MPTGYTHHQGCFLEMRPSGGVWVGRQVTQEAVQAGRRTLSSRNLKAGAAKPSRISQGVLEVLRDICGKKKKEKKKMYCGYYKLLSYG